MCHPNIYSLFYFTEHHGILNPVSELHLFALQYMFLSHINNVLQQFAQGKNNRGIRTEHGLSPNQVFMLQFHTWIKSHSTELLITMELM